MSEKTPSSFTKLAQFMGMGFEQTNTPVDTKGKLNTARLYGKNTDMIENSGAVGIPDHIRKELGFGS